jgi:hypothetical protein
MKSSDQLFQLIKSLSKGEKRNVKLFARLQDGDKKYLALFDAIDKQEEYDEAAVMREFEGEKFLKQFSVAKNYLYNFILKTLHIFSKDSHSELCTEIHQAQILIKKGLYDQAHKIVRRARYTAERRERFQELLHLLQFEREILKRTNQVREFEAFIGEIGERERKVLAQQQNLLEFTHLQDQIQLVMRKSGAARTEGDLARMRTFDSNPLLNDPKSALSQRALIKHYSLAAEYFYFVGNLGKALESTKQAVTAYESNEYVLEEENTSYIKRLANLAVLQHRTGNIEDMSRTLVKLKSVKATGRNEILLVFEKYYMFNLMYHIEYGTDPIVSEPFAVELEDKILKYSEHLSKTTEFELFFLLANFWVNAGKPSKGLSLINLVLNEPKTEVRIDIQCMARILNLVIHYELGNYELLDSLVQAATRFIYKRGRMFNYERAILKFFASVSKSQRDEDKYLLGQLSESLSKLNSDNFEKRAMTFFDVEAWVASKIEGVPMYISKRHLKESAMNSGVKVRK